MERRDFRRPGPLPAGEVSVLRLTRFSLFQKVLWYDKQEGLGLLTGFFQEQTVKTWAHPVELNDRDAPQHCVTIHSFRTLPVVVGCFSFV